jgi:hypothetical protein
MSSPAQAHIHVDGVEGVKISQDEDPAGSQAREVELEGSGA